MTVKDKIALIDLDKIADTTSRAKVQAFMNKVEAQAESSPEDAMNLIEGLIGKLILSNPQAVKSKISKAEAEAKVEKIKKMKNIVPKKADIAKIKSQISKQYPTWDDDKVEELAKIRIQAQEDRADSIKKMIDNLEKTNLYAGKVSNAPIDYVAPKEPSRLMRNRSLPKDAKTKAITEAEEFRTTGKKFKRKSPTYGKAGGAKRPYYYEYRMNRRDVDSKIQLAKGGEVSQFYVGQSISIPITKSTLLDKSVKNYFNKFAERELVIEEIIIDEPYNLAKVYDKESGEKFSGHVVLNPKRVKRYADGGEVGQKYDFYVNGNFDEIVYSTTQLHLAKLWVLKNYKKYHTIDILDVYGDSIHVEKSDKIQDINWLFSEEYAKGGMTMRSIADKYSENEDENAHSENVVLLAKHFGTPEELKEAKAILKKHNEEGYLSTENGKKRRDLHLKLLTKARAEMAKEGVQFAKGGSVSIPNAEKMMHLPMEVAVYVPSTSNVDKEISATEMKSRVKEVETYLAETFGGFTSSEKVGGYMSENSGIVTEKVVPVTAFATSESFSKNKSKLVNKMAVWAKKWGQEAMGLEFEGDLYYVPQKFKKGGRLTATYIPNEDIESIKTRFGQTFKGKDILDGAYVKRKVSTPKVTRTQFEEEEFEYAKGGEIVVLPFYQLKKGMTNEEQENVDVIYDCILTEDYANLPIGYSLKPLKSYRESGMNHLIVEVTTPKGNKFNLKVNTYDLRPINNDEFAKGGSTRQYHGLSAEHKLIADQIYHVMSLRSISEKKDVIKNSILPNLDIYNLEKNPKRIVKDNLGYALTLKSISSLNNTLEATINALRSSHYAKGGKTAPRGMNITFTDDFFEQGRSVNNTFAKYGSDNPELVNFDLDELDNFEQMQYDKFVTSMPKAEALQIIINGVEGDYSQLSEALATIAEKQEPSDMYAKGGGVRTPWFSNHEYSYGRNWTNDHRHENKTESHEVAEADRKHKMAKGGSVSPMGGQFMIDYCWSDVYVDDYEQGEMESKGSREHDFMVGEIFDFEDLFDILESNLGLSTDPSHYTIVDNKILTSRLEDADGEEPTKSEIESWKKGKTTLYSAHYTIGLKMVVVSELNDEMLSSITKINIE